MNTYRNIQYVTKNEYFVHFYNEKGTYFHDGNEYGRGSMVRSIPEGCKLSVHEFARLVIDNLYDRIESYKKEEGRLFNVSKSNRYIKNVLDGGYKKYKS